MAALDSLPRKIGPYRVIEKIGEGGMGVVYLATDPDKQRVAIKVLGPAVASDPNARQRLAREFETMRLVRSRHVAEVLDACTDGPAPYIVTRYVPARTLDDAVRESGPLRGQALERCAVGLAEALAAIHAAGVVHRDLKPGNVLLDGDQPVVIDFGIAHVPDTTRLTKTGLVMGTPGYLAPEVIEGAPSSGSADVHSWGATVAFAATGRQPFGTGNYQTIFFRVLEGQPDLAGIQPHLLPFLTAALATDPRSRPSARWLAGQLRDGVPPLVGSGMSATRMDYPSPDPDSRARLAQASFSPVAPVFSPSAGGPPAVRREYRSPAQAARDVADLLPPVVPAAVPQRRQAPGGLGRQAPGGLGRQAPGAVPGPGAAGPGTLRLQGAEGPAPAYPPARGAVRAGQDRDEDWQPPGLGLLSLAAGVGAVALSVLLPVAGTAFSLAVITLLRAVDRAQAGLAQRRNLRGERPSDIVIVIVTAPWTVVRAALTTILLAPAAIAAALLAAGAAVAFVRADTLPAAGSWAAGAAVAFYCAGPGSRVPRRQLRLMTATVIQSRAALTVAFISGWALALAVVTSALSQPPLIWPATSSTIPHLLPGLSSVGSVLHSVQGWLLANTVGMLHLP